MKELLRKIAFWIVEHTTDSLFDSHIVAMTTFKDTLYIATEKGTLYEKKENSNHWKIHRKT